MPGRASLRARPGGGQGRGRRGARWAVRCRFVSVVDRGARLAWPAAMTTAPPTLRLDFARILSRGAGVRGRLLGRLSAWQSPTDAGRGVKTWRDRWSSPALATAALAGAWEAGGRDWERSDL